jgi:polysaccharide export outer membrane protein
MLRLKHLILCVVLFTWSFYLTGCYSYSSNPKDIQAFLKPNQVNVTAQNYILQPPDEIQIYCSKVPEIHLNRQTIRPDGMISFEALGTLLAAGKTPEEVAGAIQERVSQLYVLPDKEQINVLVATYRSKKYYVLGQVYLPGSKIYTGRDTVISAIAEAQLNPMAWQKRIQVIRPSSSEVIKPKIFEVDFKRMSIHGDFSKNVLLQEGDIIYVPPTILASIGLKVEELIRPIARAFSGVYIMQQGVAGPQYR